MTTKLPGSVSSGKVCPELEVLLICATTLVSAERVDRLKILLQENIDWESLLKKATQHKLMPLLYYNLSSICPGLVPKAILTKLKIDFHYHTRHCLLLCGELVRLLYLFEEQGISVLPFKGPALAASAYGNLLLRQFGDLDILVHAEDIERAKALFLAQGYRMKIERIKLTPEQEEIFVRSPHIYHLVREAAYPFIHPQKEVIVELHWGVMPKYFAYPIDDQTLWEDLELVTIAGKSVPYLSPENALLTIVGHGTKECWTELNRISDVAEHIRSHPQLDWVKLIEKSRLKGGQRMLFLSLMLVHNLFSTPLPENVLQQIQADPEVKLLADQVCDRLFFNQRHNSVTSGFTTRFHLKVRERIQDKIQYFYKIAVTPTTSDWLLLPRAEFPTFVYYLLRPIRLIGTQIGKFFPNMSEGQK